MYQIIESTIFATCNSNGHTYLIALPYTACRVWYNHGLPYNCPIIATQHFGICLLHSTIITCDENDCFNLFSQ